MTYYENNIKLRRVYFKIPILVCARELFEAVKIISNDVEK